MACFTGIPAFSQSDTNKVVITTQDTIALHQEKKAETVKVSMFKGHSPKLATLMSAIIPGLGQAYNRSYWKIPIIYGGLGACAYFFKVNDTYYRDFKKSYIIKGDSTHPFDPYPFYTREQIKVYIDDARRYRDLNLLLFVFVYALNVVDACVDAHLYKFDISDDLSLKLEPRMDYMPPVNRNPAAGLSVTLTFK